MLLEATPAVSQKIPNVQILERTLQLSEIRRMTKQLLLVCPALLMTSAAWGATVCTTSALNVYTNNDAGGFSCTLGGLTFSNFHYISPSGVPVETAVQVAPTNDGTNVGFIFTGGFTAGAGSSADAVLSYQVSASTANILGASVTLNNYSATGAGALATIVEGICTTAGSGTGACLPASNGYSLDVYDDATHPPAKATDAVTFATAASTITISKNIVEVGGAGSATISQFTNTVTLPNGAGGPGGGPVPEPGSLFTMGSGLIGCMMLVRRRIRKS